MSTNKAGDDIVSFFENLKDRRFADADKAIKSIREKRFGDTEFQEGYANALDGILVSIRTGDDRDFLNRAPFDTKNMTRYKKGFRDYVKADVRSQFDVGYFMAWSDFVQYRRDTEKSS
jgi:hypothetical protein